MDRRTRARLILYPTLLVILCIFLYAASSILKSVVPEDESIKDREPEQVFRIDSPDDLDSFYAQSEGLTAGATEIKDIVLVTGGSGFICSHFVDLLLAEGYQVLVFDRVRENEINREQWKMKVKKGHLPAYMHIYGNINNDHDLSLIPEVPISTVVHCAGDPPIWNFEAGSSQSEQELDKVHVEGTKKLWDLFEARKHKVRRFVALSTTDIYGPVEKKFLPYKKKLPLNPMNHWAKSKLKMENFLKGAWKEKPKNIQSVGILRLTTVYGPRQLKHEGLVSHMIHEAMNSRPLPIPARFAQNSRDFLYVTDLAQSMMSVVQHPRGGLIEAHVGSGAEATLTELAESIIDLTSSKSAISYLSSNVHPDVTNQRVDQKKEKFLPEKPVVGLREGLRRTTEHIRKFEGFGGWTEKTNGDQGMGAKRERRRT